MRIIKLTATNRQEVIKETLTILKSGGLVVFPSDTVYGLLCDATNPKAVDKLLAFKERPAGKAISVFVSDRQMAEKYVQLNQNAINIVNNLLPGPFTIISYVKNQLRKARPCEAKIDPRLLAENNTLGFRIPDYTTIVELICQFGRPVTATSANISSRPPHYSIESFLKSLTTHPHDPTHIPQPTLTRLSKKISLISLIIDAGKLPFNKPSTVIDTTGLELKTLRFGDLLPATPNSLISHSETETKKLARFILAKSLKKSSGKPLVFLLQGELGTGKTIFTKGLAEAVGIKETIVSPTYTICYEYKMTPQSHPELVEGSSTLFPQLSTYKPIINESKNDIDRPNQNSKLVEQISNSLIWEDRNEKLDEEVRNEKIENPKILPLTSTSSLPFPTSHFNRLIHYDLYRIESSQDLKEIKFLESIKPGNLYSIEWPQRIDEETISKLKEIAQIIYVKISHKSEKERVISWSAD